VLCYPSPLRTEVDRRANMLRAILARQAEPAATNGPTTGGAAVGSWLPVGTRVRVRRLRQAAQHNGMEGIVRGFDAGSRRYQVDLLVEEEGQQQQQQQQRQQQTRLAVRRPNLWIVALEVRERALWCWCC
jgi:hypothetical protein